MRRRNKKNQGGITLLELLLYIGLVAIVILAISSFFILTEKDKVKNQVMTTVNDQGKFVIDIINRAIRESTGVIFPEPNIPNTELTLLMPDSSTTRFYVDENGILWMEEGEADAVALTDSRIIFGSHTFSVSDDSDFPNVYFNFTITANTENSSYEYNYTKGYSGGSTVRATTVSPITSYTITASAGAHGSITPNGAVSVDSGNNQNFEMTADSGYHIEDVLVDSVSKGALDGYMFTSVSADSTISVTFAINETVATPTASPVAGTYNSTQSVTLSSTTPGATFYYTTNGDTPTTSSTLYTGAISISSTTTLKAIATKINMNNSEVFTGQYIIWSCGMPVEYTGGPYDSNGTTQVSGGYYRTVSIGSQCWLKDNLNVGNKIDGATAQTNNSIFEKHCYNNLEASCTTYGGLYQWNEAMQYSTTPGVQGICPTGWHIPTDTDWTTLTSGL